jgi:2-oxoisovalerate dehydrogenase E1 component alpha subunit
MIEDNSKHVSALKDAIVQAGPTAIPTYRVTDLDGNWLNTAEDPKIPEETLLKVYKQMVQLNQMDEILYDIQRQGRISFYMTCYGEEATLFGSAVPLEADDVIYAQYREAGMLMWRGYTLDDFCNQCYSNHLDGGKGRQMPVHYGSIKANLQTISSPLGTQIPQASGAAYALKMEGKKNVVVCYFGEGAASEGDFGAGINSAATLDAPVIFFCRNNRYAISTPSNEQYRGDGIAARGPAYGLYTIRVDGNDFFAVHNAMKHAREYAINNSKPVLIEAMTYRVSHHSTSDDSTRYRAGEEVKKWQSISGVPRFRKYLETRGLWNEELEKETRTSARKAVLAAIKKAEVQPRPPISDLFNDVYDVDPQHIVEQREELAKHIAKYPGVYPTEKHVSL